MNSIINSRVPEFKVQAFHNGQFITVSMKTSKGNGLYFSSILPTSLSYVLPNW